MPKHFRALVVVFAAWVGLCACAEETQNRAVPKAPHYDAIIVLGCRVLPSGAPSHSLRRRARLGARRFLAGDAPQLVLTGGVGEGLDISEARVAANVARNLGVPAEAMVLEETSTSTEENARFAAAEIDAERVLVVTDDYHTFRARRVFQRYFTQVDVTGTQGRLAVRSRGYAREVLAIAIYGVLGRL